MAVTVTGVVMAFERVMVTVSVVVPRSPSTVCASCTENVGGA
ncbi:MAG: hypothetical protein JWN32_1743, partial [Solirubrobacterales bacterium]|nr:hypothetical protein [Solirubrobacterales bacterium]